MKIFDSIRKLSIAIGSRSLIAKSIAIGSIRLLAIAFALSASAAIETAPNWAESEPPIRFKSRDWADAVLAAASTNSSIAVEGGRLLSNTTWGSTKTHLVFNTVYVPSGVTLTISEGTVVKFCPGTTIKVEDGGKLSIVGASGNDVILTAANDATVGEVIAGFTPEQSIAFDGIRAESRIWLSADDHASGGIAAGDAFGGQPAVLPFKIHGIAAAGLESLHASVRPHGRQRGQKTDHHLAFLRLMALQKHLRNRAGDAEVAVDLERGMVAEQIVENVVFDERTDHLPGLLSLSETRPYAGTPWPGPAAAAVAGRQASVKGDRCRLG